MAKTITTVNAAAYKSEMEKQANLSSKGIAAVFWGSFGSALRALIQIGTIVILARILGPVEYGLFAIATLVLTFSKFFSDIGIAYGLIQKKSISDSDIKFVFTWQVILGSAVGLAVFLLAEPLSRFFNEPRVVSVIQVASISCLINAISAPSLNLLKRELDFKSIQAASIISYVAGFVFVGIPLALAGFQVWALIAATLAGEVVSLLMMYGKTRHPLGIVLWQRGDNHLLVYGSQVFLTNGINWVLSNIDRVIIGRAFPAAEIGLYSISYNLVSSPTVTIITVIQSALFSTSARVQDDFDRLRKAFLMMMGTVSLLLFPVFVGVAVAAETILHTLYGSDWLDAAPVLIPVTLAMPVYILFGMATPLLWVSGRTKKEFAIQAPIAVVFLVTAALAATVSLEAVAWVVFGMYMLRATAILIATCRALDIGISSFASAVKGGVLTTLVVAVAISGADIAIRRMTGLPVAWLIADILAGAIGMVAALLLFPKVVNEHVAQLLEKIASRLPPPADAWLQKFLYRAC